MATIEISPGICGFQTRVLVKKISPRCLQIDIETDCPNIRRVAGCLKTVDPYKELFCKLHETETYKSLLNGIAHPACVVPAGILKGIEVASGLALPKDSHIQVLS